MIVMCFTVFVVVVAEDWPQWRGPNRNGVAATSPTLLETWPDKGPAARWVSEPVPSEKDGGFGSVVISGKKAFVYASWKFSEPLQARQVTTDVLKKIGWVSTLPPDDLSARIESARNSDERAKQSKKELRPWITKWINTNLADDQKKQFSRFVSGRLKKGKDAVGMDALIKLGRIKDKPFETVDAFIKWCADQQISETIRDQVMALMPTKRYWVEDVVLCLNAADGKTRWQTKFPGVLQGWGSSCTPCIADGKCYVIGSNGNVYCLKVDDGSEVWKGKTSKGAKNCSFIVFDGLAVIPAGPLTAFDAESGKVIWQQAKVKPQNASPVLWEHGGEKYLICGSECVDVKTGEIKWKAPAWGNSTPVLSGDILVKFSQDKKVGLVAFKITPEKAEQLWQVAGFADRGSSPVVVGDVVYAIGKPGTICVELKTGKILWQDKKLRSTEISSPVFADGKLFACTGKGVMMLKPGKEGCTKLASAPLDMTRCTSPAISDGKLFLRGKKAIVCYDLILR